MHVVELLIAFLAGVAICIATYLGYQQFRRNQPFIELVAARGSPKVPDAITKGGKYRWSIMLCLVNRRDLEYAVEKIQFRPRSEDWTKDVPNKTDGWLDLDLDFSFGKGRFQYIEAVVLKPYEYREVHGYWREPWGTNSALAKHCQENEGALHNDLMNDRVEYRLTFIDGKMQTFRFGKNA